MNREEAARVLSSMRDTLKKVYLVAIDEERVSALESAVGYLLAEDNNVPVKQPDTMISLEWVKTTDRLPAEADAGVDEEILTIYDDGGTRVIGTDYWTDVVKFPERFPYWLPVPKLPEVEG